MTSLAIVIVSFNAREHLERCLESLERCPPRVRHEIVVVDNASADGSVEAVQMRWPRVRTLPLQENAGFARASNIGIRATASDLILLLNSDTMVPTGAIDRLVEALEADPWAAAAGPRLIEARGRGELSFGRMVSPFAELRQKLLLRAYEREVPLIGSHVRRVMQRRQYHDWVSGACLLVWRRDAETAGLLDERYFIYLEDVDFCASLRRLGRRILYAPEVEVIHERGASRRAAPRETQSAYRRSQLAFYEKHHPAWAPLLRAYVRYLRP